MFTIVKHPYNPSKDECVTQAIPLQQPQIIMVNQNSSSHSCSTYGMTSEYFINNDADTEDKIKEETHQPECQMIQLGDYSDNQIYERPNQTEDTRLGDQIMEEEIKDSNFVESQLQEGAHKNYERDEVESTKSQGLLDNRINGGLEEGNNNLPILSHQSVTDLSEQVQEEQLHQSEDYENGESTNDDSQANRYQQENQEGYVEDHEDDIYVDEETEQQNQYEYLKNMEEIDYLYRQQVLTDLETNKSKRINNLLQFEQFENNYPDWISNLPINNQTLLRIQAEFESIEEEETFAYYSYYLFKKRSIAKSLAVFLRCLRQDEIMINQEIVQYEIIPYYYSFLYAAQQLMDDNLYQQQ